MKTPSPDEAPTCSTCNRKSVWDFFRHVWYCYYCLKIVDKEDEQKGNKGL